MTSKNDFVVKGSGRTGVGVGRGDTPEARLHVVQRSDSPAALLIEGAAWLADMTKVPTDAPALHRPRLSVRPERRPVLEGGQRHDHAE
ncbi:hypothetical protein [Streptomyces sp. NBC_01235]|uniref:hypothetical protein n=1 Tax=Streptomyces sp. NBC_01235 TaxID=2903788 RepID=UPI002E0E6837|nr:hypothetical protein OG289_37485 [Streptomyces sp. NBC_01235]